MINKSSHQGKALLDNLQLWVLSQKEMIKPVFRQTNLTDEIEAVVQLLNPNIQKKELTVTIPSSYNPQIQISAESETKRSIFREKDKTKRSKKESAQHSKSRNKSFVMTSVSAL